jgi:hypothetical protein
LVSFLGKIDSFTVLVDNFFDHAINELSVILTPFLKNIEKTPKLA